MITNEITGKQSAAESFSPGQILAENFTLKQKLSTSETGILWLAHDAESEKDVTLLFLPGALLGDLHVIEELRAQVKLNRQLIHPHVLRTHDFIDDEGWAAISSDAVEAETLASLLAKKENACFDPSAIQQWISTLCNALDDAHRAGLLHRDFVPRNILLTNGGEILITNFGISRIILDALGRALGRGKIDEHLASMSPQQLDGDYPARWDDIYALGALIYQLLTGKPPFYSGEILPQIRKTIPPSLADRRSELGITGEPIPAAWEKVVAACLDKRTQQRPKSAREVGVKLGTEISLAAPAAPAAVRVETKEPVAPKPPPETTQPKETAAPVESKEASAADESRESLVEDIVWRKPEERPKPAPGEAPSIKRLLEKASGEQGPEKVFPILKVAAVVACIVGVTWIIVVLTGGKSEQKPATPPVAATPAVSTPEPTPQVAIAAPSQTPAATPSATAPGGKNDIPQLREELERMRSTLVEKTSAHQQADKDFAAAKSAIDAETPSLDAMKKSADDLEVLRKQREDDAAKAAADADKAAADLKAAQKAADEKVGILAGATQAKEQTLSQIKDQQQALQNENLKLQALQKAAADKQAAADAAASAEKEAGDEFQAQQDLLKQAEAAAGQAAPVPSPQPAGKPVATPSGTASSGTAQQFVAITPEKSPAPGSIEAQEQQVLQHITDTHQANPDVTPLPAATPSVPSTYIPSPNSQIDHTLTNSLGMKFQPVGDVLFCIWLTRVQDFEAFAKETRFKGTTWLQPGFKQGPDHPVVYVSWFDATAFCKWLTDKERRTGLLAPNQSYRLPTDMEWSKAVGLPEETGKTPDDRDVGIKDVYPWGTEWPPPQGAGNYDGEETDSEVSIKGYNDGYVYTSPVGTFNANKYGLYDMGGNAWEWCMDWYNGEQKQKVLRGASWYNGDLQLSLLSSCRWPSPPDKSSDNFGFRCVIATEGHSKK